MPKSKSGATADKATSTRRAPPTFEAFIANGGKPPAIYIGKHEVATLYGVSPRSIEKWAVDGTLPPHKKISSINRWFLPYLVDYKNGKEA